MLVPALSPGACLRDAVTHPSSVMPRGTVPPLVTIPVPDGSAPVADLRPGCSAVGSKFFDVPSVVTQPMMRRGFPVMGCGFSVLGRGLPVMGCGFSTLGCGFPSAGCGLPVLGRGFPVMGCGFPLM